MTKNNSYPDVIFLGQPNSGKSTLFNALAGLKAETSNFPGTNYGTPHIAIRQKTTERISLGRPFSCRISRSALHSARHCPASPFAAYRVHRLGTLCSLGVAGPDQDSGSEHTGRHSRNVAATGDCPGVGAFSSASVSMLNRSPAA